MTGYRHGYSERHSPYYDAGKADGERDTVLMSACPGKPPVGLDPEKSWSAMYKRGYEDWFIPGFHFPCDGCKQAPKAS